MKKVFLFLFTAILITGSVHAQQKATLKELTGTWNLFSMDVPGQMYFNTQTDSVFIKSQEGEDSTTAEFKKSMMKDALKAQFEKMNFVMDANGYMYEGTDTSDESKKMGQYNEEKGALILKDKESAETKEIQLLLKGNTLTMVTVDKGMTVTMLCVKK